MRYLIAIDTPQEFANQLTKNPKESAKMLRQLVAQLKPEALYFSTTRRHGVLVVDVKDPHSELRNITENLSQMGQLTVDPVSTTEEFLRWMEVSQNGSSTVCCYIFFSLGLGLGVKFYPKVDNELNISWSEK